MNILMLMAGRGARLGVSVPRQLRKVDGGRRTVAEVAIRSLELRDRRDARWLFAVADEHAERFGIDHLLRALVPEARIRRLPWPQRGGPHGPAHTAYKCRGEVDTDEPLLVCHGDQQLDWDVAGFLNHAHRLERHGGEVLALAHAGRPCGAFYWRTGAGFCRAYERLELRKLGCPDPRAGKVHLDDVADVAAGATYEAAHVTRYGDYVGPDLPAPAVPPPAV